MARRARKDVLVVGAGVSGLTTAVTLADAGLRVRVVAADPPERTFSAVAGASWGPYMATHGRILRWSAESLEAFGKAAWDPGSGVRLVPGLEAVDEPIDVPPWARNVADCRSCRPDELPAGYRAGWRYTIPLIDMPVYLEYLAARLARSGVNIEPIPRLTSLSEVMCEAPRVVNCTGLGARTLAPDGDVTPVRGQLLVVENPGVEEFFQDNVDGPDMTCVFPHGDYVVLGGVAVPGNTDLEADPVVAEQILERCVKIEPRLAEASVVGHRVGLRPQRSEVRVEPDPRAPARLVHNYGHGGSGVTLSWGCAREVARLLARDA